MASELISFRLSESRVQALQARRQSGESLNLTAQRVLSEALGLSTDTLTDVDKQTLEQLVEAVVKEHTTQAVNAVNNELTEKLEALEKHLASVRSQLEDQATKAEQWYSKASELEQKVEQLQQSRPAVVEDARAVKPLEDIALGDIGEVESADAGNTLEAHKKSGRKLPGETKKLVEKNLLPGKRVKAKELAKLIEMTEAGVNLCKKTKKLHEWGLELVPDTFPQLFQRI